MKECRVCHITKPDTDFYLCKRKGGNPEARHTECKQCAISRVKRTRDPRRARDLHLQRTYGITIEQWEQMLDDQNGGCAICGTTKPGGKHNQFCTDHNHLTNEVRQLLCMDCNVVLGIVRESPEHFERLVDYVIKHEKQK